MLILLHKFAVAVNFQLLEICYDYLNKERNFEFIGGNRKNFEFFQIDDDSFYIGLITNLMILPKVSV